MNHFMLHRDWYAGVIKTPAYPAESLVEGHLAKLHQNNFKLSIESSSQESTLLSALQ